MKHTTAEMLAIVNLPLAEKYTENHVKKVINAHNKKYSVRFDSVHNCASYINSPTYTHYQFCRDVWDFNVNCWEAGRQIQMDVSLGNIPMPLTEDEYLSLLPTYGGVL